MTDTITYARENKISADEFVEVLKRSGLGERRPIGDRDRTQRMIDNANLIVTARQAAMLVGISRAISDFSYCCYLSDLAVDRRYQGRGIGKKLIELTREFATEQSMCLLVSAPGSVEFYRSIGMPEAEHAFMFRRSK